MRKNVSDISFVVFLVIIAGVFSTIPAFAQSTLTPTPHPQQSTQQQVKPTDKGTISVGFSIDPANPKPLDKTELKIVFINKNGATQQHIDYKVSVKQSGNEVFAVPLTHTGEDSVSIPFQFQNSGTYQIVVEVDGILMQPIPPETATFVVTAATQTSQVPSETASFTKAHPILVATSVSPTHSSSLAPSLSIASSPIQSHSNASPTSSVNSSPTGTNAFVDLLDWIKQIFNFMVLDTK